MALVRRAGADASRQYVGHKERLNQMHRAMFGAIRMATMMCQADYAGSSEVLGIEVWPSRR